MNRLAHILLLLIIGCISALAQSPELKNAYQQVCKTLKEYKFSSEDVSSGGGNGQTKSITLSIKDGIFVFKFRDNYGAFADPFFGFKHGIKTIKVSIADARFYMPSYGSYVSITANDRNNVEFSYKKQKEIIDGYEIHGAEGSLKKLYEELNTLLSIAKEEEFSGTIGVSSETKSTKKSGKDRTKTANKPKSQKRIGKYVQ